MSHVTLMDKYFEWLCDIVYDRHAPSVPYDCLLRHLHNIEFRYSIPRDQNCADHGVYLRYQFADDRSDEIEGPCSVLEMMVALALRCEVNIMDNPKMGDRTSHWFWQMIVNLGLGSMDDYRYNPDYVDDVIDRFLERDYEPDGRGGLFRIRHCDQDLRNMCIFNQMCWYLDTII